jgi:hypothetical protein
MIILLGHLNLKSFQGAMVGGILSNNFSPQEIHFVNQIKYLINEDKHLAPFYFNIFLIR